MKKYLISGILAVIIFAAGIWLFYNSKSDDKQEVNIRADESQNNIFVSSFYNDIKEIKNPHTGMITADSDYIQQIANVLSQLKLEHTGKVDDESEIKYGGWVFVEFKYSNSEKIITVGLGEGEKLRMDGEEYVIKNENCKELTEKYYELMNNISEDVGTRDKLYPQSDKS